MLWKANFFTSRFMAGISETAVSVTLAEMAAEILRKYEN